MSSRGKDGRRVKEEKKRFVKRRGWWIDLLSYVLLKIRVSFVCFLWPGGGVDEFIRDGGFLMLGHRREGFSVRGCLGVLVDEMDED